jgi:hypothetical protein
MSQAIGERIVYRARGTGSGWAFSPRDFADFGGRSTIDTALHRLAQKGQVRRVIRGIYDYPRFSKFLAQQLGPDIDQVARAVARKFRWRIQPSGALALNLLGLSTQVPARAIYLSDGPDRAYKLGQYKPCLREHGTERGGIQAAGKRPDRSGAQVIRLGAHHARGDLEDPGMAAGVIAKESSRRYEDRHRLGLRSDPAWIRSPPGQLRTDAICSASRQLNSE